MCVCVLGRWVKRHYINNSNNNKKTKDRRDLFLQFSCLSVMSDSLRPHGLHAACQVSLSFTISRSLLKLMSIESAMPSNHLILPFFSHLQSCPASGSLEMSHFFASGGQSICSLRSIIYSNFIPTLKFLFLKSTLT